MTQDEFNRLRSIARDCDSSCDRADLLSFLIDNAPTPAPSFRNFGQTEGIEIAEMVACICRGQKIPAMKALRTATGGGLKECKDTVEAIERVLIICYGHIPHRSEVYPVKSKPPYPY
jgi:hypothetical protein